MRPVRRSLRKREVKALEKVNPRLSTYYLKWTPVEQDRFVEGFRIYGKNWKEVAKLVQTRDRKQTSDFAKKFYKRIKSDPNHPDYDLLPIFKQKGISLAYKARWIQEEKDKFVQGLLLYGKNWKEVAKLVQTRDRKQTCDYAKNLYKRIKKD